jgi:hypothetical protein
MAQACVRSAIQRQSQFSPNRRLFPVAAGLTVCRHPIRGTDRTDLHEARQPVWRVTGLFDGHDGMVVPRPTAAGRQGSIWLSCGGARGGSLSTTRHPRANFRHQRLLPRADQLSVAALREPSVEVAAELESQADPKWLWSGLRAKLVDDSKFTMPDTPASEARYRSPRS